MYRLFVPFVALAITGLQARAATCTAETNSGQPHWILDHYHYDPALHRDWQVLVDCNHPAAPEQTRPAPSASGISHRGNRVTVSTVVVHAGAVVEVSSTPNSPTAIRLSGTAMQTAFVGQPVRVRLASSGRFITALALGPHSVELVQPQKPQWGHP
jgi:hypothetical protein